MSYFATLQKHLSHIEDYWKRQNITASWWQTGCFPAGWLSCWASTSRCGQWLLHRLVASCIRLTCHNECPRTHVVFVLHKGPPWFCDRSVETVRRRQRGLSWDYLSSRPRNSSKIFNDNCKAEILSGNWILHQILCSMPSKLQFKYHLCWISIEWLSFHKHLGIYLTSSLNCMVFNSRKIQSGCSSVFFSATYNYAARKWKLAYLPY